MAKTSTERSKLFRKKLTQDPEKYNVYKARDKERKRIERSKKKPLTASEVERVRQINRERKRKSRMMKKAAQQAKDDNTVEETAYSTPQALGKAVGKVKSCLPKSPRKRKAVITKLAKTSGLRISKRQKANFGSNKKMSPITISKVKAFYCKDYVSRQAPGKKDFVISWQNGKKEHIQKRHMMFSLKEAHAMFKKEHPEEKIGVSKFSSLRPINVLLSSETPRNVCLCQYHENIRLICDCLAKETENFPGYSGNFVDKFVCDSGSEECMLGGCTNCSTYNWLDTVQENCKSYLCDPVTWYQWERVEVKVPVKKTKAKKVVKKMKKVCREGTIADVFSSLRSKLPHFLEHVFVKRQQSDYFEDRKANLQQGEALVQVDFAENYSCKHQDEIQSAHWNQDQISLFTVAVWTKSEYKKDVTCESHVIVSDDLQHDKTAVTVFMSTVLDKFVKQKHPEITTAYIFSDGPSSQFKNKYIVSILPTLDKIVHIQWNYFATSHGKGAVDGIGGTLKRLVWNAVSSRKVPAVTDARSFYEVASMLNSTVAVYLLQTKEIREKAAELVLSKCFKEAVALPGISRFHCIEPQSNGYVHSKLYSTQQLIENEMVPRVFPFDLEDSDASTDIEDSCSYDGSDRDEGDIEDGDGDSNDGDHDDILISSDNTDDKDDDSDEDCNGVINDDLCITDVKSECHSNGNDDGQNTPSIKIDLGLPPHLSAKFGSNFSLFKVPLHTSCLVDSILRNHVKFKGSSMIDERDLHSLIGGHSDSEANYLTNFVIDEYLQILKATREDVSVISWEIFETFIVKKLLAEKENLLKQEIILVPCNNHSSKHWFLTVVFPKEKLIAVLDSMPGDFVKPNAEASLKKMWMLLQMADNSLDVREWQFVANKPGDLPQQDNEFDCGVFASLYARCLITNRVMLVDQPSIQDFRKHMMAELHKKSLLAILPNIQLDQYYAVDFVNIFYIGRALDTDDNNVTRFKFLHTAGARKFDWPKRDDVTKKHCSCVFYGPVTLIGNGPFEIRELSDIESVFKNVIKKAN